MKKLAKLDAIRGIATIYVVIHHIFIFVEYNTGYRHDPGFFSFGIEMLIIFFVLSGFVIELSFERSGDKSFKLFFTKRFLRVYIPLIIVFAANYIFYIYQSRMEPVDIPKRILLGNLLMLQDGALFEPQKIVFHTFLGNLPLWSLAVEWWFYMFFFFVIKKCKQYAPTVVYTLGIVSSVIYCFYPIFIFKILILMLVWWLGVECAKLYIKGENIGFKNLVKPIVALVVSSSIFIFFANTAFMNEMYKEDVLYVLQFTGKVLIVISIALIWHKLKWKFFDQTVGYFKPIAKMSYVIYISHWFLVCNAAYLDFIEDLFIRYALYFIVCIMFAYVIEHIIYTRAYKLIMSKIFKRK